MTSHTKLSVTVLTTVYNGLPHLNEAIESTLNQTYKDFNYLIIDDASTDQEVVPLIQKFDDNRINLVLNDQNLGVSDTFNKALEIIDSDILIRLDQDDVSLPNRIEEIVEYFKENQQLSVICSWEHTIDTQGKPIRDWKRNLNNYGDFIAPILMGICPIWHPSIAFRTKDLKNAGGFNSDYIRAEDFEVTARLAMKRYEAGICPKYLVLQREHDNRQSIQFDDIQHETTKRIQKECIEKFMPDNADLISKFLLLDIQLNMFDKALVIELDSSMRSLKDNMRSNLNLSFNEMCSVENNFNTRLGYGLKFINYYKFLPNPLFMIFFYLFSPTHIKGLRNIVSSTINYLMELKYNLKGYK